jgi:nucleoside-diphosphate-sugar epimerase
MAMKRRVLITGASGFLGRHIVRAWEEERAEIASLGRSPGAKGSNNVICNLSRSSPDLGAYAFDTVIHCAGKAHLVPKNKKDSDDFLRVNVEGTSNLLRSLEAAKQPPQRVIFISSVAVYGRNEGIDISETESLNGRTPYAESKIQAERLIAEWSSQNNVSYFNLRLPLVVGVNPPGNLGRMATGIRRGTYIRVRNNQARKSMVLAGDIARLTLQLQAQSGSYNLTDRVDPEFSQIEDAIAASLHRRIHWHIPGSLLKLACRAGNLFFLPVNNDLYSKVTASLTFSSHLAREKLEWKPRSSLDFIKGGGLFEKP